MTAKKNLTKTEKPKSREKTNELIENQGAKLEEVTVADTLIDTVVDESSGVEQSESKENPISPGLNEKTKKKTKKSNSNLVEKTETAVIKKIEKVKLTEVGFKKLKDELRDLIDTKQPEIKVQLKEAREQGDLSENADYDAARTRQAEIEGKIHQIEAILSWCEIIKVAPQNSKKVGLGSTVTIKNLADGKKDTYTITGTTEADAYNNKISNISPLGEALIGKEEGDVIVVKSRNEYKAEILEILNSTK